MFCKARRFVRPDLSSNCLQRLTVDDTSSQGVKPKGLPHLYPLDKSISNIRAVGGILYLYSNFNRTFCKRTVKSLIRCHVMRHLIFWIYTVCQ